MNEMRLWTGPVKGAALFFAAAFSVVRQWHR